jgi:flagellar motor switch protein FliG
MNHLLQNAIEAFQEIPDEQIAKCMSIVEDRFPFVVSIMAANKLTVIKHMDESLIEYFTLEVSRLDYCIEVEIVTALNIAICEIDSRGYMITGGVDRISSILDSQLGTSRAIDIYTLQNVVPYHTIRKANNDVLYTLLKREKPQTVALVLSNLDTDKSAEILKRYTKEEREDILLRIENMSPIFSDVAREVERVLDREINNLPSIVNQTDTKQMASEIRQYFED